MLTTMYFRRFLMDIICVRSTKNDSVEKIMYQFNIVNSSFQVEPMTEQIWFIKGLYKVGRPYNHLELLPVPKTPFTQLIFPLTRQEGGYVHIGILFEYMQPS